MFAPYSLLHPTHLELLLSDTDGRELQPSRAGGGGRAIAIDAALPRCLAELKAPVTRDILAEDPALADLRERCLKNVEAPVRVFRLASPAPAPPSPASSRGSSPLAVR